MVRRSEACVATIARGSSKSEKIIAKGAVNPRLRNIKIRKGVITNGVIRKDLNDATTK